MIRFFGIALLIGAAFVFFNRDKVTEFKRNAIETVNPAAKEKRLMDEIGANLNKLDALLADKNAKPETLKEIASTINNAKQTLAELQQTNEKLDLGANLSNLIQKIVPLAEKASPTWLPPGKECPTN